ncbi:MAG: polyphosphate polymerase domain-containing protein [Candidatus Saccharibacteria bacterium]|nr:polyphosphate polymerase domain-containing protein [Candidatus Saccharibacteria bacterium]
MQDQKTFDRIEKKCLITKEQKQHMLEAVKANMHKDSYFESEVYNIYFDTDNYDLIIQSIEQPMFKEKLRARSYGGFDKVFFEIKTKLCGKENNVGYKRRVRITKSDYNKLVKNHEKLLNFMPKNADGPNDYHVAREVDYLIDLFDLKPKILVFYIRQSWQGEGGLRITFDEDLKYRTKDISFSKRKTDKYYFDDEKNIIMEIKAHGVLPLWLVKKLSAERIFPQQFSKVGKIYQKIGKDLT